MIYTNIITGIIKLWLIFTRFVKRVMRRCNINYRWKSLNLKWFFLNNMKKLSIMEGYTYSGTFMTIICKIPAICEDMPVDFISHTTIKWDFVTCISFTLPEITNIGVPVLTQWKYRFSVTASSCSLGNTSFINACIQQSLSGK